ncbi:hypothetical protein ACHAWF_010269 [Thalassiosira exigua]
MRRSRSSQRLCGDGRASRGQQNHRRDFDRDRGGHGGYASRGHSPRPGELERRRSRPGKGGGGGGVLGGGADRRRGEGAVSLRLSRGDGPSGGAAVSDRHSDRHKRGVHRLRRNFPVVPHSNKGDGGRGRSSEPKSAKGKRSGSSGSRGEGIAGRIRSLSQKGTGLLRRRTSQNDHCHRAASGQDSDARESLRRRAPSLQPETSRQREDDGRRRKEAGRRRKRGASLPSRVASSFNRSKSDLKQLAQNLGESRTEATSNRRMGDTKRLAQNHGESWTEATSGRWSSERSRSRDDKGGRRRHSRSMSHRGSRKLSRSLSQSRRSPSQPRRSLSQSRSSLGQTHTRPPQRRRPPPPPPRRGRPAVVGRGANLRRDVVWASGGHDRQQGDFVRRDSGRLRRPRDERYHGSHDERFHDPQHHGGFDDPRSKSLPPLERSRGVLYVDSEGMRKRPVSPVASVDSSWRYRMIKRKERGSSKSRGEGGGRVRSRSLDARNGAIVKYGCRDVGVSDHGQKGCSDFHLDLHLKYDRASEYDGPDEMYRSEPLLVRDEREQEACENDAEYREPELNPDRGDINDKGGDDEPELNPLRRLDSTGTTVTEDDATSKESFTLGTYEGGTYEGSQTWRGRAPKPVDSLQGSTREGIALDESSHASRDRADGGAGGSPDSPGDLPTAATGARDPPNEASCELSPQTFVELSDRKSDGDCQQLDCEGALTCVSEDSCEGTERELAQNELAIDTDEPSDRREGDVNDQGLTVSKEGGTEDSDVRKLSVSRTHDENVDRPAKDHEISNKERESYISGEKSVGSRGSVPSTAGSLEKVAKNYGAPPSHSSVRSKKPSADHERSWSRRSSQGSDKYAQKDPTHAKSKIQNKDDREGMLGNKLNLDAIRVESSGQDLVSEITMPRALLRAPPPHAKVRARKPRNRNGSSRSSHKESKEGVGGDAARADRADHVAVSMAGKEIGVRARSTGSASGDTVSELTMPVALYAPFAKAFRSYERSDRDEHSDRTERPLPERPTERHAPSSVRRAPPPPRGPRPPPPPPPGRHGHQSSGSIPNRRGSVEGLKMAVPPQPPPRDDGNPPSFRRMKSSDDVRIPKSKGHLMVTNARLEESAPQLLSAQDSLSRGSAGRRHKVGNLPFVDERGNVGLYSGETNRHGRPHGRGRIQYDSGSFFEGTWINGSRQTRG